MSVRRLLYVDFKKTETRFIGIQQGFLAVCHYVSVVISQSVRVVFHYFSFRAKIKNSDRKEKNFYSKSLILLRRTDADTPFVRGR